MNSPRARKVLWGGGIAVGVLLVVLGAVWIWQGASARSEVHDTISQEQIVGSPDMSPEGIRPALVEAKLVDKVTVPDCDVAEEAIDTGDEARCFAEYMRVHALESSGGRTYGQMGRFLTADGEETPTRPTHGGRRIEPRDGAPGFRLAAPARACGGATPRAAPGSSSGRSRPGPACRRGTPS